jgi:hypothetical protein
VPARAHSAVRRLDRLRWLGKLRALRASGARLRDRPSAYLRYVLLDPELDNYTFEVSNEEELAAFVADVLRIDRAEAAG